MLLRVCIGDAHGVDLARQVGGALNVVALLGFAVITAGSAIRAGRPRTAATTASGDSPATAGTATEAATDSADSVPPKKSVTIS